MQILHSTELIIKSILETRILKAYCENKTELHIYADKIKKLSNYNKTHIDYNLVLYMMHCLSKQQLILEKTGFSFYTFCLKDIIVIDDTYFFCINSNLIMPIKKNMLLFFKPITKKREEKEEGEEKEEKEEKDIDFNSPELAAMISIPFKLSYKTIYYSLGALAIYYLGNPSHYEYTKLYWFIKRCIGTQDKTQDKTQDIERQLLFI